MIIQGTERSILVPVAQTTAKAYRQLYFTALTSQLPTSLAHLPILSLLRWFRFHQQENSMPGITTAPVALEFETFLNVIDGKLSGTEATRCSVNPSTLEENPQVPLSTPADVDKAILAAANASSTWAETPWAERQNTIKAYADALDTHVDNFARMLVSEQGKPVSVGLIAVGRLFSINPVVTPRVLHLSSAIKICNLPKVSTLLESS